MLPLTCCLPCFNDSETLPHLLKQLHALDVDRIVVVDDGSHPPVTIPSLKKVVLIRHSKNQGKSAAIATALNQVNTPHVFLCDADCTSLDFPSLSRAISHYLAKLPDLLILRRATDPLINRLIRTDIVLSGQRLQKTHHLRQVLKEHKPTRFQLELAINTYMINHHQKVYWYPLTFKDRHKLIKRGIIQGIIQESAMYRNLLSFPPPFNYPLQLLTFAHSKLPLK